MARFRYTVTFETERPEAFTFDERSFLSSLKFALNVPDGHFAPALNVRNVELVAYEEVRTPKRFQVRVRWGDYVVRDVERGVEVTGGLKDKRDAEAIANLMNERYS